MANDSCSTADVCGDRGASDVLCANAADKLVEAIRQKGAPIVVGLDPRFADIPPHIVKQAKAEAGPDVAGVARAIELFNFGLIDSIASAVPAVKPQIAFYELYGSAGIRAYEATVACARAAGLIVIGDAKRNDIGSTAEAYADGHLGAAPTWENGHTQTLACDWLTVNGYLGSDGIAPFVARCSAHGRGIFVLVRTSNPSAREVQDIEGADGRKLYRHLAGLVDGWGRGCIGRHGYSAVGAVVGATYPAEAADLRREFPGVFFLVPGYGAQGGGGADVAPAFDENGGGALVNSSRGIICAYQSGPFKAQPEAYAEAALKAVQAMRDDISRALAARAGSPR